MSSTMRRALINALIVSSTGLLVSACASAPPIVTAPSACSSLIAPSLRADVAPVDLPGEGATAGELWSAFDGQSGRLDVANTYKRAAIETVERCEARDAQAVRRITAPWWKRPFLKPIDPG